MRPVVSALVAVLLLWAAPCAADGAGTGSLPADDGVLAARSVRHSAMSLVYEPNALARAERLIALVGMADRLLPNDPKTHELYAFIYRSLGQRSGELRALEVQLNANPNDYAKAVQWISLRLSMAGSTEQATAVLDSIAAQAAWPAEVRAYALAERARLELSRGNRSTALQYCNRALQLDPYQPSALRAKIALLQQQAPLSAAQQAAASIALISGNPFSEGPVYELAILLDRLGLYTQAVELMDNVMSMVSQRTDSIPDQQLSSLAAQHFGVLLDAEQYDRVIRELPPVLDKFPQSSELWRLLLEAYREADMQQQASDLLEKLHARYEGMRISSGGSPRFARELAWFYLTCLQKPDMALSVLQNYRTSVSTDDVLMQMLIGAAEIGSGRVDDERLGVQRLQALADKNPYAAAFLAEYYFSKGDSGSGRMVIETGAAITRSGGGYRMLRRVARRNGAQIVPTLPGAAEVAEVLKQLNPHYLKMGRNPGDYVRITIEPLRDTIPLCDAVSLRATISNAGPVPLPLAQPGASGLQPRASLEVRVTDSSGQTVSFSDLPMVTWPAPRYLGPGRSVSTELRIDVGRLALYLLQRPLEDVTLSVSAILSPQQQDSLVVSSVPGIEVAPVEIKRLGLYSTFGLEDVHDPAAAYRTSLAYIVRDIKAGSLERRMRAARQTACLLGMVRQAERGRGQLPEQLNGVIDKSVMLRMVQEILKDHSPVVRAELLTALQFVKLDDSILQQLGQVVEDPDPLVRFRMAELIGTSRTPGKETLVDYLAQDDDELVQAMAKAVQGKSVIGR